MRGALRAIQIAACLTLAGSALSAQAVRLAQTATRVDFDLAESGPVRAAFDSLLGERLRAQGFEVIPPQVYDSVWLRWRDSVGGYFDPFTGRVVDTLYQVVLARTRETLRDQYAAQAIVYQLLDVFRIPFGGGKVEWYGASEEGGGRGGLAGALLGRSVGSMPAITLVVAVYDLQGRRLARGLGGIQLLVHIEGGKFVEVPRERLFADPALMTRAVRYATDSLPEPVRQGLAP